MKVLFYLHSANHCDKSTKVSNFVIGCAGNVLLRSVFLIRWEIHRHSQSWYVSEMLLIRITLLLIERLFVEAYFFTFLAYKIVRILRFGAVCYGQFKQLYTLDCNALTLTLKLHISHIINFYTRKPIRYGLFDARFFVFVLHDAFYSLLRI